MKFTTCLSPALGLLAFGLAAPAVAGPSVQNPTYTVGTQTDGSIVVSSAQIITPAGISVDLGSPVRAKAVAVNPNPHSHTGAVLLMGAQAPVQVFDVKTGEVKQRFLPAQDSSGSYGGITYSQDGKYLFFSQDSSNLAVAHVDDNGLLSEFAHIALPSDASIPLYTPGTAYPGGIAVPADGQKAFVLLNQNNTVGVVDLTTSPPQFKRQIRVGNVPNSIVIKGNYAYVSNEGGRKATAADFTDKSSGTPIVSDPKTDSASTGTVSVIDLSVGQVVDTIKVGLHPTGMAVSGPLLFVANAYSDSVSVIDTGTNKVMRTIKVGVPIKGAFGAMPTSIVVHGGVLYVTLMAANAVAVVDLTGSQLGDPVIGYIPTAYAPSTIAFDASLKKLLVSNDKGVGTQGSLGTAEGVTAYNTHHDTGTVSIIPLPTSITQLDEMTTKVFQNNHWDLTANTQIGPKYADPNAVPKAIPDHIGEPSLIKHVFLIIKENRTYDQIFGDVPKGNGDPSLAVFGPATPNQHALIQRFPLIDNAYAPSRQSADGHPWIVSSISAYSDEIQSPDWIRSYPGGNSNDEMVYTPKGFLWQAATARGLTVKMYGEWSGQQVIKGNYSWADWYNYSQILEGKKSGTSPITPETDNEYTTVPSVYKILDPHYPSFNTGIPDQYRVDVWAPNFAHQEATGTLPNLVIMWLPDDHTSGYSTGYPIPTAAQADNDLALGRIVETISNSRDWPHTAIFVEEDDAQDGVDHVDGHRQPVFVISPYAKQNGFVDHTTYTAENINRTIEQILGLTPLTQFDLVASPMTNLFTDTPNTAPFTHLPPTVPLDTFPGTALGGMEGAWNLASNAMFIDKYNKADAVDETILNRVIWYSATNFAKPYPGDDKILPPSAFHPHAVTDADGDGDGF